MTPPPSFARAATPPPADLRVRKSWVDCGCPTPPPHDFKIAVLKAYAAWCKARVFVETGTWKGETTAAMQPLFPTVCSIELAPNWASRARQMFARTPNVEIIEGDSAKVLPDLLGRIHERCLFWLDGHWCGNDTGGAVLSSAVMGELETILAHEISDHVLIIDDARYFVGAYGYPTVDQVRRFVKDRRPDLVFDVAMDSIRIHPETLPSQPSSSHPTT